MIIIIITLIKRTNTATETAVIIIWNKYSKNVLRSIIYRTPLQKIITIEMITNK